MTSAQFQDFLYMVEESERSTHRTYLTEIIQFQPSSRAVDSGKIASLYLEQKLSSPQIASQLGCSKSFVITSLKRMKLLRTKSASLTDPTNYRNPVAPYGLRVIEGRLVTHPAEMKVCRLIVDLFDRQGKKPSAVAEHLIQKGIKNRRGQVSWHPYTVGRAYKRWKGKL